MNKLAESIIRFRWLIAGLVLLISIGMVMQLPKLKVNADVLGYLPEDDRAAILFKEIGKRYGGTQMVIIGLEHEDVFSGEMLDLISQVTDSVRAVPGVGQVTSLTNVMDIRDSEYGIEIGRLIDVYDIPEDEVRLEVLREYVLSKDLYKGNLVSADASASLVIAKLLDSDNRSEVVEEIQKRMESIPFEGNVYYGGMPVTLLELTKIITRDIAFIAPLAFILISLVLFLGFRRIGEVALPMISVLIAIIWTMGSISLLGYEITLLTNVIPAVLLAVGSAYAIHVINAVRTEWASNPQGALLRAVSYVIIPVFLASLTTVFGFLSFIAGSYLSLIKEFGIFMSVGILFALLLTVFFIPSMLAIFNQGSRHKLSIDFPDSLFDHATRRINHILFHKPTVLLLVWALILLFSLKGMFQIERRVDLVDYFKKDNIVQKGEAFLKKSFNGSMLIYVSVKGDIQSPEVLRIMEETQLFMDQFGYIPHSQSVADLIRQMNEVMGEEGIPDDAYKIAQLWFLLEGQEIMEQLVNYERTEGIIQAYVSSSDLQVLQEIETNLQEFAREKSNEHYQLEVTGTPIMFRRLDESIIKSQTLSLIIAIILVVALVSLLQKSITKGLLAIIPIAVTLVVLFGTMGNAGIPLDIATALTGSVTIGIGIDYAIHFISYLGNRFRKDQDLKASIQDTILFSGRAILINMSSVTLGFAMLLFSRLVPLQRFGLLLAVTMITASLATLTLLPLALQAWEGRMKRIFSNNKG
jgi:uncharacterized protein